MTKLLIITKKNTRVLTSWLDDNRQDKQSFLIVKLKNSWRFYGHYKDEFMKDGIGITNFLLNLYLEQVNAENYTSFQKDKCFLHLICIYANNYKF